MKELQVNCPAWTTCIRGACGLDMENDELATAMDVNKEHLNSLALATSVIARVRNKSLSALAYRISSILLHSGTSHQDIIFIKQVRSLHQSPDMILHLQSSLGENFDSSVFLEEGDWGQAIRCPSFTLVDWNCRETTPAAWRWWTGFRCTVVLDLSEETVKDYISDL